MHPGSKKREFFNAFIEFEDEASAQASVAGMNGKILGSSSISVAISDPSSKKTPYFLYPA